MKNFYAYKLKFFLYFSIFLCSIILLTPFSLSKGKFYSIFFSLKFSCFLVDIHIMGNFTIIVSSKKKINLYDVNNVF